MNNELENFGRILIQDVRDRTIKDIDKCTSGIFKSERAIKISKSYNDLNKENKEFVDNLISEVVDNCIHNFLDMMEQNEDIQLYLKGKELVAESDGLAGELYTEDGWIQKFSTERNNNK